MSLSDKILDIKSPDLSSLIHNDDWGAPYGQEFLTRTFDAPHDAPLGATHDESDTRVHDNRKEQLQAGHDDHHYLRVNRFLSSGSPAKPLVSVRVGDHNLENAKYSLLGKELSEHIVDAVPIQGQAQYAVFDEETSDSGVTPVIPAGFRIYDASGNELGTKTKYDFTYTPTTHQLTVVRDGDNIVVFSQQDSTTSGNTIFRVSVYATGKAAPDSNRASTQKTYGAVGEFPFARADKKSDYVFVKDKHYFTWLDSTTRHFYQHVLKATDGALLTTALAYAPGDDKKVTELLVGPVFGADGYVYTVAHADPASGDLTSTYTIRRAEFKGDSIVYSTSTFEAFRTFKETRADTNTEFTTTAYTVERKNGLVLPKRNSDTWLMGPDGFDELPVPDADDEYDLFTEHGALRIAATGNDLEVKRWRFSDEDRAGATYVELHDNKYVEFTNAVGDIVVNGGVKADNAPQATKYALAGERDILAMSPDGTLVLDRDGRVFKVPFHTKDLLEDVYDLSTSKFKDEKKFNALVAFVRTELSPLMVLDQAAGTYVDPRCMCLNPKQSAEQLYTLSEFDKVEQDDILKIIECFSTECARVRTGTPSVVQRFMQQNASGCSSELLQEFIQPDDHTRFWVVIGLLVAVVLAYVAWKMTR